jgi:hypothetical protein
MGPRQNNDNILPFLGERVPQPLVIPNHAKYAIIDNEVVYPFIPPHRPPTTMARAHPHCHPQL